MYTLCIRGMPSTRPLAPLLKPIVCVCLPQRSPSRQGVCADARLPSALLETSDHGLPAPQPSTASGSRSSPSTIDDEKGATPAFTATPASTPTTRDTSRSGTSNSGTTTGTTSTSDSDIDRDIGGGGGDSADGRAEPAPQSPAGVIASLPPHISQGVLAHMPGPERVELALDEEAAGVGGPGCAEKMEEVEEGELESDAQPKHTCAAPPQEVVVLLTDSDFSREGL